MHVKRLSIALSMAVVLCLIALGVVTAQGPHPQGTLGTAFTYQGQLKQNNAPANGLFSFTFKLFDAPSGGSQIGGAINQSIAVTNGLFTTLLDFGASTFNGDARWLSIAIGADPELTPRQAVTAAPYALCALQAGSALMANSALPATRAGTAH